MSDTSKTTIHIAIVHVTFTFNARKTAHEACFTVDRGGGIGGLTLAVALSRLSCEELSSRQLKVDIYESTSKLTQVGAGITLWPRGWEVITALGLDEALSARLTPGQGVNEDIALSLSIRKSDQKEGTSITDVRMKGGSLSLHRADVQEVLLSKISSPEEITFHLSHRLASYQETLKYVQMSFDNGTTATCDMLVGADGINSVVRRAFMANDSRGEGASQKKTDLDLSRPIWTGTYVYRSLVDSELIRRIIPNHRALTTPMVYCGKAKHIISYPIQQGKFLNTVSFMSRPEEEGTLFDGPTFVDATTDEIIPHFTGWEDEAQVLLNNMHKPTKWAIQAVRPLNTYAKGRVALLGDSAHAMAPHLGNGAGQAIEDAYILAHLISKATRNENFDTQKVLSAYSTVRQPIGNFVASVSRKMGQLCEFSGSDFEGYKEGDEVSEGRIEDLGTEIREEWDWTWKTSAKDDLDRALALM